jgi:hypothetical protein
LRPCAPVVVSRCAGKRTRQEIQIEFQVRLRQVRRVKATAKRRAKSEAELLDHATNNLLRALKRDMVKKGGRVDRDKLRKDGYSDRLLDRLEQA